MSSARQLITDIERALPPDVSLDQPIRAIDADGFVHELDKVVYDTDDQCFYIRTNWSYE